MIKLSKLQSHRSSSESDMEDGGMITGDLLPQGCCQYFIPGHLPVSRERPQRQFRSLATTYLSYSPSGEHLLANLGGENIYLYDTCRTVPPVRYTSSSELSVAPPESKGPSDPAPELPSNGVTGSSSNGFYVPSSTMTSPPSPPSPSSSPPLPSHVESLKERALEHYKTESWASAVMLYSEALQAASHSALLFR
ncbi:hypothetical protein FHG87_007688 [Trinorchestia longiramus]|nr:hypothetical protein FHG87_007688 [Trinorchestia longiramus]